MSNTEGGSLIACGPRIAVRAVEPALKGCSVLTVEDELRHFGVGERRRRSGWTIRYEYIRSRRIDDIRSKRTVLSGSQPLVFRVGLNDVVVAIFRQIYRIPVSPSSVVGCPPRPIPWGAALTIDTEVDIPASASRYHDGDFGCCAVDETILGRRHRLDERISWFGEGCAHRNKATGIAWLPYIAASARSPTIHCSAAGASRLE